VADATALRLATLLLALDGLAALHLAGLLGTPAAVAVALGAALAWRNETARDRVSAVPGLGRGIVIAAAVASALDLVYVAGSALDAFARLLVFLLLYRLVMRRALRDLRDVAFLAFFMLVAAAPLSFGIGFLGAFLAFLVLGTWMLMLYHVASEAERADARIEDGAGRTALGRDLLALSLGASGSTLAITAALFVVIPRVGQAALTLRSDRAGMISGFSDRVELGSFGEIETDATVVMRVRLPEGVAGDPERLPDLRWRGLALDRYDGRGWSSSRRERATVRRSPDGRFELARRRDTGPVLLQEIYLEPFGADALFAAPRPLRLELRASAIVVDDMGGVSAPSAAARFRYVVESELPGAGGRERPLSGEARARFLALPPLPARVRGLALDVTQGARAPRDAARALTSYLATRYRYSRALRRTTALDPVEEFLFVQKSGNCEYFAASLAVMLRALGIPARVVNGFQRGEWNPYGRYFMVRLLDAHSWVEAYLDGDWVTLDPSPRAGADAAGAPAAVALYLDALRVRWYRYVVNWSLQDQVMAALRIRGAALAWSPRAPGLGDWRRLPREAHALLGLILLALALLAWRRRSFAAARPAAALPAFYRRALRALARRDLVPAPGETVREFAARVAAEVPGCGEPFRRLTTAYERQRFGANPPTEGEQKAIERTDLELRSHLASFSGYPRSDPAPRPPLH
jgi:transglutaminase-like putative cysteine protease